MGVAYHRAAHGVDRPTVGLLNVGSEEMKGHEEVREANRILREGQLDLAVMPLVLFFVPDPARGVAEMARCMVRKAWGYSERI